MVSSKPKRSRLNMRIPSDLLDWARGFATGRNTNLTQLFIDHLTKLREQREQRNGHSKTYQHR